MNNQPKQYYVMSGSKKFGYKFDTPELAESYCKNLNSLLGIKEFTVMKEQQNSPIKTVKFN